MISLEELAHRMPLLIVREQPLSADRTDSQGASTVWYTFDLKDGPMISSHRRPISDRPQPTLMFYAGLRHCSMLPQSDSRTTLWIERPTARWSFARKPSTAKWTFDLFISALWPVKHTHSIEFSGPSRALQVRLLSNPPFGFVVKWIHTERSDNRFSNLRGDDQSQVSSQSSVVNKALFSTG